MLIQALVQRLKASNPQLTYTAKDATVWCLAHVVHLAITVLMVAIKVAKKGDIWEEEAKIDLAINLASVADAEHLSEDSDKNGDDKEDKDQIVLMQQYNNVDMTSPIQKVRSASEIVMLSLIDFDLSQSDAQAISKLAQSWPQCAEHFKDVINHINKLIACTNQEKKAKDGENTDLDTQLKNLNLILDVITCWNLTFFMLEHTLKLREVSEQWFESSHLPMCSSVAKAIDYICGEHGNKIYWKYWLSRNEWKIIEFLTKILKVCKYSKAECSTSDVNPEISRCFACNIRPTLPHCWDFTIPLCSTSQAH